MKIQCNRETPAPSTVSISLEMLLCMLPFKSLLLSELAALNRQSGHMFLSCSRLEQAEKLKCVTMVAVFAIPSKVNKKHGHQLSIAGSTDPQNRRIYLQFFFTIGASCANICAIFVVVFFFPKPSFVASHRNGGCTLLHSSAYFYFISFPYMNSQICLL